MLANEFSLADVGLQKSLLQANMYTSRVVPNAYIPARSISLHTLTSDQATV